MIYGTIPSLVRHCGEVIGLAVLVVVAMLALAGCGSAPQSPDRLALIALYHAMDGQNWENNDKWTSKAPLEEWYGVTTDDGGRVTELYLPNNRLVGKIPAELGNLTSMHNLVLGNFAFQSEGQSNQLTGAIPPELGNLANLENLSLHDNQLTGNIPSELGNLSNLTVLYLCDN